METTLPTSCPMHSLSNPARHGLRHVLLDQKGEARLSPNQNTVISGDLVMDEHGELFWFIGQSADRKPIITADLEEGRKLLASLDVDRMHA